MHIGLTFLAIALTATAAEAAPTAPPRAAAQRPTQPIPAYAVVEGAHSEAAVAFQSLTVACPRGHKAFGAGFTALVRQPGKTRTSPPFYAPAGLDLVRSEPDFSGDSWKVEGVSPDAVRLKQPWRLAVRVVCVAIGG